MRRIFRAVLLEMGVRAARAVPTFGPCLPLAAFAGLAGCGTCDGAGSGAGTGTDAAASATASTVVSTIADAGVEAGPPPAQVWPPAACAHASASSSAPPASPRPGSYGAGPVLRPKGDKPIALPHGYAWLNDDGLVLRWNDDPQTACPPAPLPVNMNIGDSQQVTALVPPGPGATYFTGRAVKTHVNEALRAHAPVEREDTWMTLDPFEAREGAHVRGTLQ